MIASKNPKNLKEGDKVKDLLSDFHLINTKSVITFVSNHLQLKWNQFWNLQNILEKMAYVASLDLFFGLRWPPNSSVTAFYTAKKPENCKMYDTKYDR